MSGLQAAVFGSAILVMVVLVFLLARRIFRRKLDAKCKRSDPNLTPDERDAIPPNPNCPVCVAEQAMKEGRLRHAHYLMSTMRRPK